jgi:hypothetical protein
VAGRAGHDLAAEANALTARMNEWAEYFESFSKPSSHASAAVSESVPVTNMTANTSPSVADLGRGGYVFVTLLMLIIGAFLVYISRDTFLVWVTIPGFILTAWVFIRGVMQGRDP